MIIKKATLATLAYYDIFDYPLKKEQIRKFLTAKLTSSTNLDTKLKELEKEHKIGKSLNFYFLAGRRHIVSKRLKRENLSKIKLKKALFFAKLLQFVPTVKMVAVTGALAMENSTSADDIDLLVITSKNMLWTTRLMANLLLLPYKRYPKSQKQKDKACLNIFIDESDLKIKDKNIYTAHEIVQMMPLYNHNNTYQRFINSNNWIYKFLPNWKPNIVNGQWKTVNRKSSLSKVSRIHLPLAVFNLRAEKLLRNVQLKYMQGKITTEKVTDTQLFFHPKKTQEEVLNKYRKQLDIISKLLRK